MNYNKIYTTCSKRRIIVPFGWFIVLIGMMLCVNIPNARAQAYHEHTQHDADGITGRVTTSDGQPIANVRIAVKGSGQATESDRDGWFSLETEDEQPVLIFQKDEYIEQEVEAEYNSRLHVELRPSPDVHLLWGKQQRDFVAASVSTVSGDKLMNLPGSNRNNVLGGRLTGLTVQQHNGTPGLENSTLYVRGLNTLSSNSALIVVDGYPRENASYLNPHDIESITVLKDAAATAMYGMRGGAGVVQITTKRGNQGPLSVGFNTSYGFQEPTRFPSYLSSYEYAYLYNEASRNDGGGNVYSEADLEGYRSGTDPFTYPDIGWRNQFLNDVNSSQRYNLTARGGSDQIQYFASLAYDQNSGIYNVDKEANSYNTNQDFENYSLRTNLDIQISSKLQAQLDVGIQQKEFNYPGNSSGSTNRILTELYNLPPNVHPVFNADSSLAGTSQYTNNPYGLINMSGYSKGTTRAADAIFTLTHSLDGLTEGLSARGSVYFDSYFSHDIRRHKGFYVYEGNIDNERGVNDPSEQVNQSSFSGNQRAFDLQLGLDYQRSFGLHNLTGRVFANEYTLSSEGAELPRVYRGLLGRVNYVYNNRYIADLSFAWQGSEQIGGDNPYILYPALALGWIVSEESFLNESSAINFLKVRASHGLTGNDRDMAYFQKQSFFDVVGTAYHFGTNLSSNRGFAEGLIGNPAIKPETNRKSNIGIDAELFGSRVVFSGDVFYEKTTDIIVELNRISGLLGAPSTITSNAGIVENRGFELALGYGNPGRSDFQYSLMANVSYAKSKIIDMQERTYPHPFNYRTGHPVGSRFGLVALGFFQDEDDIANSPDQSAFGSTKPGDLKYRDVNNDGIIDQDDFARIGKSWLPEMVFGATLNLSYKGIDFSALVEGATQAEKFLTNYAFYDFYPNGTGNLMDHHLNRWAYYPDLGVDTRATATYPRLSLQGENSNNKQPNSTFWLKDASYLRVKSVELGYSLPEQLLQTIALTQLRVYATVYNAFTFDKIEVIDPEVGNGAVFPIQRMINFGINLQF